MSNENVKILLEKIQKKLQKSAFKDLAIVEKMNEQFENKLMEQDNNIDFNDFIKNIETDTNPASQAIAKKLRVAYLYINLDEPIIRVNVEPEVKAVQVLPEVKPVVPASALEIKEESEAIKADKVAQTEAASGAPVVSPAPGPGPSEIGAAPVIPPGLGALQAVLQSAGPAGAQGTGQAALPPGIQSALASLGTGPAGAQGTGPAGIPGLAGLMSGTGGQGTGGPDVKAALAAAENAAPIATGFAKSAAKFAGIKIPT